MQLTWSPTPGQVTLIELAESSETCLTGIVMESADGSISIDLGASPRPPRDRCHVVASFFQAEALYKLHAVAVRRDGADSVIDLTVDAVDRVQRRSSVRSLVTVPVTLSSFDGPGDLVSVIGTTVDVSTGGCRVRTTKPFPEGADPTVSITLPEGHTLVIPSVILHRDERPDGWEYRMAFGDVDEADEKLLSDLAG